MKKDYTLADFLIALFFWIMIIMLITPTINAKIKNLKFNTINRHLDYDFTR